MEPDATSQFGEVARLNYVNWLDVSAVFHGIVPGRYYVQWSLIVSPTFNIENTLFRAATIPGHEASLSLFVSFSWYLSHCMQCMS
jgi:hypothetical protein